MSFIDADIKSDDISKLMGRMLKNSYKCRDSQADRYLERVMQLAVLLAAKDYQISTVTNTNGELCSHYPSKIILMEYEADHSSSQQQKVQSMYPSSEMKDLFGKARFARCRERFPVPVILFKGKSVCRSSTLSIGAEMYTRSGMDMFFSGGNSVPNESHITTNRTELFDKVRGQDICLLERFGIRYIADLMLENKKVKFFLSVSSSEKADKWNRYSRFHLLSLPYPGCEFYKIWRDNNYSGEALHFDWSQGFVNSTLDLPQMKLPSCLFTDWQKYRTWDIILLTQNYLKLLLNMLKDGDGGLLVHCISGWDRTPLFISLLRISLWADGHAHRTLNHRQMLFFTLAYDWFLFGHNLPDRFAKGEEICFFCFDFLKYIASEDFSIDSPSVSRARSRSESFSNLDLLLDDDTLHRIDSTHSLSSCSSVSDNPVGGKFSSSGISPSNRDCKNRESSPICVPAAHESSKQFEQTSCGSWQVVSSTGSIRDKAMWDLTGASSGSSGASPKLNDQPSASQAEAKTEASGKSRNCVRASRIRLLREEFFNVYHKCVASHTSSSSASGAMASVASLIGKIKSFR